MNEEQKYRKKLEEIDSKYTRLQEAIIDNRYERDIWQGLLDGLDKSSNGFPTKGNREAKIKFIFKNIFQRAVRMSELEDKYTELNKEYHKLVNVMRRMKDEGTVLSVRYNKQNTLTFWGLSEWIEENDFKDQYKPLPNNFKGSCLISGYLDIYANN
ncbi:hypothetical protein [Arenibacter sp. F20364]|uniref:hypothetical protein n=1 Tax=Arenibacter sp. F20364 TaxID=2926415 RepID=UPI001FF21277|nr:hypothetical protein [Arenibacter sp. F20364]MCK0190968.1 hypothetical protein [Arenibacter sp. F20364]